MDRERWDRVQTLFHAAAELPAAERPAFLESQCGPDADLIAQVMATLDADARGAPLLDTGVGHLASRILGDAGVVREIGPYRLGQVLGEGGMGVVFLAERPDLGTVAAIKILRDAWLSPARRARFSAEQRTLAHLNHPAIARWYDAGVLDNGTPWIAMEYVEGTTLTEYCRLHAASVPERLRLFREVCDGVQHAHRHLIVHRDLKPSNILVTRDGRVKLLDFGIAKQLDSLDLPVDQTRTALRLMTPAYASPEQLLGGQVGTHTDVYALGVLLYELLAGRLPFDVSNRPPTDVDRLGTDEPAVRPSAAARDAGGQEGRALAVAASAASWSDLDVLCLTAMHKEIARRYQTVEALIRDIDHYAKGEPLEARADTFGYRTRKFVRRRWRILTSVAAIWALFVGLVGFYAVRLSSARNAAVTAAARAERIQGLMLGLFTGGHDPAGPSDDLRVITMLDRGVLEANLLDGEPVVQAELYQTLGGLYGKLGNLERAEELQQLALVRRRALFGAGSVEAAESLVALGLLRVDQARLEEAEQLVREGLDLIRVQAPPRAPEGAAAMAALGQVLQERGSYDEAIKTFEEAIAVQSSGDRDVAELAASLRGLAGTHFYAGDYERADAIGRRALAITREVHGERHPLVANDLITLGAIQHERGRYAEAERYYRDALPVNEAWYGSEHHQTAANLTMLGRTLVYEKRFDEAVELLQRALAIQERVFGPIHPRVASAVNDLGSVALQRNRLDEAEAAFRRMVDIYRAVYDGRHYLMATAVSNLASVHLARNELVRAEALFREAVAQFSETLSPDHLNTGIARLKLGRALVRQRRYQEAEVELLAGYRILGTQTSPSVSWLRAAREDLVTLYDASGKPREAAEFRSQLTGSDAGAAR